MADMVGNENVTTLRRRHRPKPMHSARQEKNRSYYIAAEKAEGPIARGNRGFRRGIIRRFHGLRRFFWVWLRAISMVASQLSVHQNHLRPNHRYWRSTLTIELEQTAPMTKPILIGNQECSLVALPKPLEALFIQIEIAAYTKISRRELHFWVGV